MILLDLLRLPVFGVAMVGLRYAAEFSEAGFASAGKEMVRWRVREDMNRYQYWILGV